MNIIGIQHHKNVWIIWLVTKTADHRMDERASMKDALKQAEDIARRDVSLGNMVDDGEWKEFQL